MILKWNRTIGALALSATTLSAMALGIIAPSAAFAYEDPKGGQHFDRGRWPRTYKVAGTGQEVTCPGPECTPEFVNDAIQRGQITPKEATKIRKLQSKPSQVARNKSSTIKPNPPTVARNASGWIIPTVSALAVGAGVLAATSGDNNAASPN